MVQWLRLYPPNAGGLGIVPGQGTRSHMPQLKDPSCLKKILHVTTQTHSVQPNKYICRYFKCLLFKSSRLWCFHAPSLGNECRCMQNAKPLKAKALAELGSPIRPGQDAWASCLQPLRSPRTTASRSEELQPSPTCPIAPERPGLILPTSTPQLNS